MAPLRSPLAFLQQHEPKHPRFEKTPGVGRETRPVHRVDGRLAARRTRRSTHPGALHDSAAMIVLRAAVLALLLALLGAASAQQPKGTNTDAGGRERRAGGAGK